MAKQISREELHTKAKKKVAKRESEALDQNEVSKIKIQLIPLWLRLLLVAALTVMSLTVGLMVGYGVIGDGKPIDALKKKTWTHIVDLVVEKK